KETRNPTELFQIWLNLPKRSKMVDPYFTMFWSEDIPVVRIDDAEITLYTGNLGNHKTLSPPPHSWASQANSDIAVWSIKLKANGRFTLPKSNILSNRCLYFFSGETLEIENRQISVRNRITLHSLSHVDIQNGSLPAEILLLQGNPIGEPTAKYGPFVMNTQQEIRQAIYDYQRTGFGGWPWDRKDPVHNANSGRFALHADGTKEERK
ncbi:MAG: pirin-like C-terminal cupin domain-containing protein, partial [Myxococcota bacterium]|nr:pirin-like C-terminal cupin domain-containing protein [Myxococcota bacterium]